MKILALETSAQPGAIALLDDQEIVHESGLPENQRTTESFANSIKHALQQAGWRARDVQLLAVCEGPGSFTGLRIGITAAKTFAYATGANLLAIPTLEVLASQVVFHDTRNVWVALNAQRQQLFVAHFEVSQQWPRPFDPPRIVDAKEWLATLPPQTLVTGGGLAVFQSSIPSHVNCTPKSSWTLQAKHLGRLAGRKFKQGIRQDWWQLTPKYYRLSAAEEKLQQRKNR